MKKHTRVREKSGRNIIVILALAAVIFLWFSFGRRTNASRFTVAFHSNPVIVWSWDIRKERGVVVSIPDSTLIEAIHGYGKYPISSLWKLGELNQKNAGLLSLSLSEVLGVPVPWYMELLRESKSTNALGVVREAFSLKNLIAYFSGSYRTNISPRLLFKMVRIVHTLVNSTTVTSIDLSRTPSLRSLELADGTQAYEIDEKALDTLLGNEFEDEKARQEAIPVGVYNTTDTPTLGTRMARAITHLGGNVLLVDNSTNPVTSVCLVSGKEYALKSYTAAFLIREFGCVSEKGQEVSVDERVDLAVFVGQEYAKRFEPITP